VMAESCSAAKYAAVPIMLKGVLLTQMAPR
jgi:hypothetical protein